MNTKIPSTWPRTSLSCAALAACTLCAGCLSVADLPESFDVAISSEQKISAARGSGPAALAGGSYTVFRKEDGAAAKSAGELDPEATAAGSDTPTGPYGPLLAGGVLERPPVDSPMFVIEFDDAGAMVEVRDNLYFFPTIYGEIIDVGGAWNDTVIPGASFRSASYGVDTGERLGIAIVVQVQLLGQRVAQAVIYAWGTAAEDRFDGQFGYVIDFSEGVFSSVLNIIGDQYPFYATLE